MGARILTQILWYDQRDGNGIAEDLWGNEFYIDISVLPKRNMEVKYNEFFTLVKNPNISHVNCGWKLKWHEPTEVEKLLFSISRSQRNIDADIESVDKKMKALEKLIK